MALQVLCVQLVKIVRPQLLIGDLIAKHVVDAHQQAVGHRYHGTRLAPSTRDALIERMQIRPRCASDRGRDFAQDRLELFVALGAGPTELFAGTALVTRADTRSRSEMSGTWEATHVCADLGNDGRSAHGSGRWQGQQELHRFFLLGNQGGNIHLHPMDRPL